MIADYAELIAEVSQRTGQTDVASRAAMFVGMAERVLSRRLRVADAEATATVASDAFGVVDLPDDYIAPRALFIGDRELRRLSLAEQQVGNSCGYAVQGGKLLSSEAEADHVLHYYAALPSLEANDTNWLLESDPETYLQAVMFQVYSATGDVEKAQITDAYMQTLIERIVTADNVARYSQTHMARPRVPV